MKHAYWQLTLPSGATINIMVAPEITQETADQMVVRLYGEGTILPHHAPDLPQTGESS